jgi:hypothetical protein
MIGKSVNIGNFCRWLNVGWGGEGVGFRVSGVSGERCQVSGVRCQVSGFSGDAGFNTQLPALSEPALSESKGRRVDRFLRREFCAPNRGSRAQNVWRSGNFDFCTGGSALGDIELVVAMRFRFCTMCRGPTVGVQNPMVLHGAGSGLPEDCSPDADRSRSIFDELTFIVGGFSTKAVGQTSGLPALS